ncbi:metal-dependent hydrolase [Acinetobacter bereziniae]|jgi:predicted metal-dependent hydrolase|uniref:metal-dependent hydrolase n=1 Tax=Acinetobacter bereziniae TaxID=106648 RepID=UPI000C2CDF7E|nr:metal-dependent hydrolase [Acinetobacter bereziniae]ATZ64883.1 metal-dependent hydrolase [Acinetobacter bereziniae]MBJ8552352.1 metal-dependent hydrolase [Acinetobacter bereziniae]MCU4437297.1 metal-dependent hydrolase [Acinetobacter bereziniae]MCV2442470.1 metal-dependent hydrolase [Acinetobacter bereziniae]MDG3556323.1 metal-dependent hydrolase [Acinetobacter bereziniae]
MSTLEAIKINQSSTAHRLKASFPVRRLSFDFTSSKRYWFDNDAYFTHLMNAMSAIFPQGELMLIEALRNIRDKIDDPLLQAEISAFIGQEAMHAKEHLAFNRYADEQQINIDKLQNEVKTLYAIMQKILPSMHIMSIGCAIEHITATLGAELLRNDHWNNRLVGPVAELWLWHAVEENEHKAVFFDAYVASGGGYVSRIFYMTFAGSILTFLIANNTRRLLKADRMLSLKGIAQFLKEGVGHRGLLTLQTVKDFLDYYRPDFHPFDHDTKALEKLWQQRLDLKI